MKITAKRQALGDYGLIKPGQTVNVTATRAKQLIASGLFVAGEKLPAKPKSTRSKAAKAKAATATADKKTGSVGK